MNFSVLLVIVSAVLISSVVHAILDRSRFSPKLMEYEKTLGPNCASKTGTDQASIDRVKNGEFVDEPTIKAYMVCLLVDSAVTNDKGEINFNLVREIVPTDIAEESLKNVKTCYDKARGIEKRGDRIFELIRCYYYQNPDLFFFF